MQDLVTSGLLLLAEFGLVAVGILLVTLWIITRNRGRARRHANQFVESYNTHKEDNLHDVVDRLKSGCGMEQDKADAIARKITSCERCIYLRMIDTLLGRQHHGLFKLKDDMEQLRESWLDIASRGGGDMTGGEVVPAIDASRHRGEIDFLKKENSRISDNYLAMRKRLDKALDMLEGMLNEYSRLYGKDDSNQIVEAMNEELEAMKKAMREVEGGEVPGA